MIQIRKATQSDLPKIREIALKTWPVTFGSILSVNQIDYMLEMMYNLDALKHQVKNQNHVYLLACEEDNCLGFISYETNYKNQPKTKIHKIYILPEVQGKGVGKLLMDSARTAAERKKNTGFILNVNKYNVSAVRFYEKIGYGETGREDIDIGGGYLMEDIIMEKAFQHSP